MGLQHHIMANKKVLSLQLRKLFDALYRRLHAAGIGTTIRKTPILTYEDENQSLATDMQQFLTTVN